jgi:hypothetical protein
VTGLSPLSLDQLTRDSWGAYDASAIAQLATLADDDCYSIKFYKAPSDQLELVPANSPVQRGLVITPGSVLFGFYLPCIPNTGNPWESVPPPFTVQITDMAWDPPHDLFSEPVGSLFLANFKPCSQLQISASVPLVSSFPNLLPAPYAVVGDGLFVVDIQSTSASQQRIELVFGVLEACEK